VTEALPEHLARLPVRVPLRLGEGTDSFIRRLAQANHLKPSYLRGCLVGPPDYGRGKRPRADRLAAVTGHQQDVLERVLADLVRKKRPRPASDKPKRRVTASADKPALFTAIRRDAPTGEQSVRKLAAKHRVSPYLVRQALASPTPPPRKERAAIQGRAKGRVGPAIDAILDEYAATHAGELPTIGLVWERLLDEHDASVSYGTVHRYMSNHPLRNPDTLTRERGAGNYLAATQQTFHANVLHHYKALLTAVRREPARHGLDGSFSSMTAFVLGLDAGGSWNMLTGFQEWLVVRLGQGHDLTWPLLVRHLTPEGWTHPLTKQADAAAVITLHRLLGDFFTAREQPDGLGGIFRDYQSWKITQDWYQLSSDVEPRPAATED
jgi:hypothetical protein